MNDEQEKLAETSTTDFGDVEDWLPRVYPELRRMANRKMMTERSGHTLQPTALVNEVLLRLLGPDVVWQTRAHFMAAAAEAMRRILIDWARHKQRKKRDDGRLRVPLSDAEIATECDESRLLEVEVALARFEQLDPQKAQLVKLRFFVGLSIPEVADQMGISVATANRHWKFARAWLQREMESLGRQA
jgi:RNA polymerase sigma factor (TIGR02999 family)